MKINNKNNAMYKNSVNTVQIIFSTLTLFPELINGGEKLPVLGTVKLNDCWRRQLQGMCYYISVSFANYCTVLVIMKLGLTEEITSKQY